MSAIETVLAGLAAEGTLDSEGAFTLDREKAREKMRQFQLADPLEYLLQLVRAAVLQGATALDFTIDADDMWLSFDGNPLTIADFDELYGALFGRAENASLAARRHLALGVNAALALEPRHLRIESGEARLEARPGEDDVFGPLSPARTGTRVHVRDRFRFSHVGRFFGVRRGTLPERTLLGARAAFCPVPLTVNGERLDLGLEHLKGRTATWVELEENGCRVVGGHAPPGAETVADQVVLVAAGVTIRTRGLVGGDGFTAVGLARGLRTDVSQADVVQDAVHDALMGLVEKTRLRSLAALLQALPDRAPTILRRQVQAAVTPEFQGYPPALARQLAELPLWRQLGGATISTDDLRKNDVFSYVSDGFGDQLAALGVQPDAPLASAVLLPDPPLGGDPPPGDFALFKRWFGDRIVNRTADLERFIQAEKNRRAWRHRFIDVTLPNAEWLARKEVEAGALFGEIGLHPGLADRGLLRFAAQGCLLGERKPPLPLPGLEAVIHGPFQPTDLFDDLQSDATFEAALDQMASALPALLADLATRSPKAAAAHVRAWLGLALEGDPAGAMRALLAGKAPTKGNPSTLLANLATGQDPPARVPLFRASDGTPLSLADLTAQRSAGHLIRHISPGRAPLVVDPPLVVVEKGDLALLEAIFGKEALTSGLNAYTEAENRKRFLSLPPAEPIITPGRSPIIGRVPTFRRGYRGEVGLRADRDARGKDGCYSLPIQLWVEGRPVELVDLPFPLPGFAAAMQHADFKTDFSCSHVQVDRAQLLVNLAAPFAEALYNLLVWAEEGGARVRLVRALIDLVMPTDQHRAAWEALHATWPADEAEARYLKILQAGWGGDPEVIGRTLAEKGVDATLSAGRPEVAAFTTALLGPPFFADPDATPLARLLAALPVVGAAPVFATVEGEACTLSRLVEAEKPLLHAQLARNRPEGYSGPILLGNGPAMPQLQRLFGADALMSTHEWSLARVAERTRAALPAHDGRLDRARVLVAHALPGGGEVGLRLPAQGRSQVHVVQNGRLLVTLEADLSAAVEAVVADDGVKAKVDGVGVRLPAQERDRLLARVEAEIPSLLSTLVADLSGLAGDRRAQAEAHLRGALLARVRGKARRPKELESDALTHNLSELLIFQTLGSTSIHLLDLARMRAEDAPIWVTDKPSSLPPPSKGRVLQVDAAERELLKQLFGQSLPEYAAVVAAADQERAFLERPVSELALPGVIAEVPVRKGAFSGKVGLAGPADDRLEVLKHSRLLGVTRLGLGLVGLSAVVNDDEAEAVGDWTSAQEGPRLDKLRGAVAEEVPRLMEAARGVGDGTALRALAWSIIRCAVPSATWAELFRRAVEQMGPGKGVDLYHDALRCLFQDTSRTLDRLVQPLGFQAEKLMVAEGGPRHSRGDAFVRALFGGWPLEGAEGAGLTERLITRVPALGAVPLVRTVGGVYRTLAELVASAPRGLVYRLKGEGGDAEVLLPPKVHWSLLEGMIQGWKEDVAPTTSPAPPTATATAPAAATPAAPATATAPPTIPPSVQLIERIREILRGAHSEIDLDQIQVGEKNGKSPVTADKSGVVLDARHPLVALALKGGDPAWDLFLAAATFGALNRRLDEVKDADEVELALRLAARLR